MTLSAANAYILYQAVVDNREDDEFQKEIGLVEKEIRNAISRERTVVFFDASKRKLGNPVGDINNDADLTSLQKRFRDELVNAGYLVDIDEVSGFWRIEFGTPDTLASINVYAVYTTVTPGAIMQQTIDTVQNQLATLVPSVKASMFIEGSGDVDETLFGAVPSVYYRYTVLAIQQDSNADISSDIKTALLNAGLGYLNTNLLVSKIK